MGATATTWPTLLDIAKRLDPGGSIANVAEILNLYNEILDDIAFVEGNLPTGHKTTVRAFIPAGTWRLLNQGIVPQKSTSNQITDTCGMLENYSEIDIAMANLNGNSAEWRLSEEKPVIEGMGQSFATSLIYGDTSINPERFVGLAPRYWTITAANSATAANVIDGKGTGSDNTSVWLVGWSTDTIHGIYPKGSKAGLTMKDLGEQTIYPGTGQFQGYRTHYKHDVGLSVRDWRFVVRICNIDVSDLQTAGDASDTSTNLVKLMSLAIDKFPPIGNVRPVFYMNQTVRGLLRVKLFSKSNTFLTLENWEKPDSIFRRPSLGFMGIPCRRVDAITNAEATIT